MGRFRGDITTSTTQHSTWRLVKFSSFRTLSTASHSTQHHHQQQFVEMELIHLQVTSIPALFTTGSVLCLELPGLQEMFWKKYDPMLVSIHTAWIISRTRWTMLERNLMILLLRAMSLFKNLFLKSGTSSTPDWRTSQVLLTIFWSRWIRSLRPTGLTSRSSSAL